MKKFFYLAAAAVVAMAACTKTEVVETTNDQNAINFNAFFHKATKATLTDGSSLTAFEVTAMLNSATYFDAVAVSGNNTDGWTYSPVQYWPASGTLDFFAWAPTGTGTGITKSAYNDFIVAPAQDAASQYDFVVARTQGTKDATTGNGAKNDVTINFRHAMSQIDVKVFNGNKNLQYDIYGWKVCGVDVDGEYLFNDASTDGTGKIAYANWCNNTGNFTGAFYDDFDKFNKINASANETSAAAANITGATTMILVPQTGSTAATKYTAATASATQNGSYIAIDMCIKNATDGTVVASRQWCCWPVAYTWNPGYKYTYIIDLSQGGYKELNDGATETSPKENDDLDKVLDDAEIVFATVTVDAWDETLDAINVNM